MKIKTIKTTIILGEGEFSGGGNTKIFEGLATTAQITKAGLPEKNSANVSIYGLKMSDMEQLTFLSFQNLEYRKNHILIEAGDKGGELSVVFKGDITAAYADFSGAPDIVMKFQALTAGWSVLIAESPTSVDGETPAAELIKQFAQTAGYNFVNEGVTESVRNATFVGSPIQKAQQVADEVGAQLLIDDETMTLMPWDKPRGDAVLLKETSGMIGYPSFTQDGVSVECFFNPALRLGGQIKIESIVPRATGYWKITKLTHDLAAYTNGRWISKMDASWLPEESESEEPEEEYEEPEDEEEDDEDATMSETTVRGMRKPNTAGSEYNAQQFMIQQAIRSQVNTAIPVTVQAVDGLYVDVLPLVTNVDGFGETVQPTTLFHLPFFRYHAGVAAVIVDPVPGDIGLAVFAQKDCMTLSQGNTTPQQPGSFRRLSMSDGFYVGGFLNKAPSVYIEITQGGAVNIVAPSSVNVTSPSVNCSGDVVISGKSFLGHTHMGVHGETSPPL